MRVPQSQLQISIEIPIIYLMFAHALQFLECQDM